MLRLVPTVDSADEDKRRLLYRAEVAALIGRYAREHGVDWQHFVGQEELVPLVRLIAQYRGATWWREVLKAHSADEIEDLTVPRLKWLSAAELWGASGRR